MITVVTQTAEFVHTGIERTTPDVTEIIIHYFESVRRTRRDSSKIFIILYACDYVIVILQPDDRQQTGFNQNALQYRINVKVNYYYTKIKIYHTIPSRVTRVSLVAGQQLLL